MNHAISTAIVAPMTSKGNAYPTRIQCTFQGVSGQIVLDQIRTIDKTRMVKRLGKLSKATQEKVLDSLSELFAP